MSQFFAYKNRWGTVVAAPHDFPAIFEACKSPSVVGVIRLIEAENQAMAEWDAKELFQQGQFEKTFGAENMTTPPSTHIHDDNSSNESARQVAAQRAGQAAGRTRWKKVRKTDLELLPAADAETEKKIAGHVKVIRSAIDGHLRARSLFRVYALIGGAHANFLAELAPHGQAKKILQEHFDDVSRSRLYEWRKWAKKLADANPKSPTVGLLTAPSLGKKQVPLKMLKAADAEIDAVLGDQSYIDFLRDKPKKEPGGYRYDKAKLEKWLKEHHPDHVGKTYEELPPKIQSAFRKFNAPEPMSAEDGAEINREQVRALWHQADEILTEKTYADLDDLKEIEQMDATFLTLHQTFKQLINQLKRK